MRLLLFSDLHGDRAAAQRLVARAAEVDVVVGAGDFGVMRRGVGRCFQELREIDRPAVLVPGNAESFEQLEQASRVWPAARVLHGGGVEILGQRFFGLGGGVPVTPFGPWSYDFSEDDARALLADCPEGAVLVSHSPPYGVVDVSSRGRHLGSVALREAIERTRPRLVACGHIHDAAGERATLGGTLVVNAGPGGVEVEL